jgi:Ser/Thr protein kinase RdoA (MazF antagonist)
MAFPKTSDDMTQVSAATDGFAQIPPLLAHARQLLTCWGLDPETPVALINLSENATFSIGGDLILRIHRQRYSSYEEIASELSWLAAVRTQAGVNTPEAVPNVSNETITSTYISSLDSHRFAVMFRRIAGREPQEGMMTELFEPLGALTARLHQHSLHWKRPPGFTRRTWNVSSAIGPQGHWGDWREGLGVGREERRTLGALANQIEKRLSAFGNGTDRFGLIHADLRMANLLVTASGDISVIDFDDSGFSWFGYDLGASLSFIEDHPQRGELIESWCVGYRSVAPLDQSLVRELMTFVMLRRLVLTAWFGTHSNIELAQTIGPNFAAGTCELAEEYLQEMI